MAYPTQPSFLAEQVASARYFFLDLNPPKKAQLVVTCGGVENCLPDYHVARDTFAYYSVELVASGHGEILLANQRHSIAPGAAFCYGPGVRHEIIADPNDPPTKYFIDFAGRNSRTLLKQAGLLHDNHYGRCMNAHPHMLVNLLEMMIDVGISEAGNRKATCAKLLEVLMLRVADAAPPVSHSRQQDRAYANYRRCRQIVQDQYQQIDTLEDLAEACNISAAYLCRLFRRFGAPSPYQLLMQTKMNFAANMLLRTDKLIKDVAMEIGFPDPYHFSRAFKSIIGLGPQAFRASHLRPE